MRVLNKVSSMQEWSLRQRYNGARVSLVPTMGYLHEGHLSLIRLAREHSERVVVSVFVNPTQFGPTEDYEKYPRDTQRDLMACDTENVDVVLLPSPTEMYAHGASVWVDESHVSATYEGAQRPGHFRGVLTVVAKLFNAVQPSVAVFGEKDAQQLWLIKHMVKDLFYPIRIESGPTRREPDGLAMSSRNVYLSREDRAAAVCLYKGLSEARTRHRAGEFRAGLLLAAAMAHIRPVVQAKVDYLDIVSEAAFTPLEQVDEPARMIVAARFGKTRLIDTMRLDV